MKPKIPKVSTQVVGEEQEQQGKTAFPKCEEHFGGKAVEKRPRGLSAAAPCSQGIWQQPCPRSSLAWSKFRFPVH